MPPAYADAPATTRSFLWLRSLLTPYGSIAAAFPEQGRILDLGCGHGLLALALSRDYPRREVIGIDHDPERILAARAEALRLGRQSGTRFEVGDLRESLASFATSSLAGVAMIDMLHYFEPRIQEALVHEAARVLVPGGILAVREIDRDARIRGLINRLYERLATGIGFTRLASPNLSFRGARQWTVLIESAGFTVRSEPCGPPFLADFIFRGRKAL